jgi:acyl-CoA synthetase (AMP-forming)/AMP-acid ligase II/1-acyl-sn-glycerol-3-phosphate acyltransferase
MLRLLFVAFGHWLLRLRYRVRVIGLEKLRELDGPTLVMPNHPGYIDPPLVLTHIKLPRPLRPVVTANMYRRPVMLPFFRLLGALEVPEVAEVSQEAREQSRALIDAVVAGLQRGQCFQIYPSGRSQRRGLEVVGAARAASEILTRYPDANVVLVRTRGVWGSQFSYARTGNAPNLEKALLRGLLWGLASLVFFLPRRQVTMTVEVLDRRQYVGLSREELNRFLEQWYNEQGPEMATYVPYHLLFGPRTLQFPDLVSTEQVDPSKLKPETIRAVNEIIQEHLGRPLPTDTLQADMLLEQIGLDSLDRMEVSAKVEDRFGFRADRMPHTLGELWALGEGSLASPETPEPVPPLWTRPPSTNGPTVILAETLTEAFVRRALTHQDDAAAADKLSGVVTYRKMLVGTRLLASLLEQLPEPAIGVLLPASVAADIGFFAVHLAGKLPVMLNWTTGPSNLAHAVQTLSVRHVVTSRKLLDRLGIQIPGVEYIFLEELRSRVGKWAAVRTLLATYLAPKSFLRRVPRQHPDDPAVVLFTSGSESAPKAVPLTHGNLVANCRAALEAFPNSRRDCLLGCLPPFHSFGLLAGVLAPHLTGIRVVHSADPSNAPELVRTTARYGTTVLVTTPTFLGYMTGIATKEDLQTARIIVTGAEKCPDALFARTAQLAPQATILEGYGITECSPVVSANCVGHIKPGTIGRPMTGVEICVVDPESHAILPPNTTGMLLVHGVSVFHGYLGYNGPNPFTEVDGKRWYVTGDLVQVDDEGFVHFQGRLKRFLKAGGEMISLPALEEPLARAYPPTEKGPQVAVEGIETPTGRRIVLFATREIALPEANALLSQAGYRGIMRLDQVKRLEAIPLLGTGKTDYKVLRKMIVEAG